MDFCNLFYCLKVQDIGQKWSKMGKNLATFLQPCKIVLTKNEKTRYMANLNYYLDGRTKRPTVKMMLSHKRKTLLFSIGIQLENVEQWSGVTDAWVVKHPGASALNNLLRMKMASAQDALYSTITARGEDCTIEELKAAIMARIAPEKVAEDKKENENGVLEHYYRVMAKYEGRTWEIYETTLRRIREYAEDRRGRATADDYERISSGGLGSDEAEEYLRALCFDDITEEWLDGWRECMAETKGLSTQSIYLRTFRHVCKDAFDHDLTSSYVWKRYKVPKPDGDVAPLTEDEFARLFGGKVEPFVEQHRRVSWLGFCLIGMNIADMHQLEWSQIREGYVRYVRRKTHRKYCIRIDPEAMEVINEQGTSDGLVMQFARRYKLSSDYRQHLNHALKCCGVEDMHYYRIRHTWATFANRIGIQMDTIARCLGHGRRTVTDIYVEVDQREIDDANRRVIDYALEVIRTKAPG